MNIQHIHTAQLLSVQRLMLNANKIHFNENKRSNFERDQRDRKKKLIKIRDRKIDREYLEC